MSEFAPYIKQNEALIAENNRLKNVNNAAFAALETIASRGGNLSDEQLESRTGPNDAVARGIMYTTARSVAREALKLKHVK